MLFRGLQQNRSNSVLFQKLKKGKFCTERLQALVPVRRPAQLQLFVDLQRSLLLPVLLGSLQPVLFMPLSLLLLQPLSGRPHTRSYQHPPTPAPHLRNMQQPLPFTHRKQPRGRALISGPQLSQ